MTRPDLVGRLSRLDQLLERQGLNALLVVAAEAADPDLAPFVGPVHLGHSLLIAGPTAGAPKLGYLTAMERDEAAASGLELITPESLGLAALNQETSSATELWTTLLERALENAGVSPCRVALAGRFPLGVVHRACSELERTGWHFTSGHEILRCLRRAKTPDELTEIRRVTEATCRAMRRVAEILASSEAESGGLGQLVAADGPLTAGRLRRAITRVCAEAGFEQPHGNIVAAGRDAGVPHSQGSSERQLREGESIVVDLYPRGRMFSDCTRTFCVGSPPDDLSGAHRAVLAALERAHRNARSGASGWDLQQEACEVLGSAGYPTATSHPETTRGYVHGLGHGVGLELHEYPSFRREEGEAGELAEGDVFTLEPGLYDPDAGYGVRLEDLCHLGPDGLEILTDLPYDLDPKAWQ